MVNKTMFINGIHEETFRKKNSNLLIGSDVNFYSMYRVEIERILYALRMANHLKKFFCKPHESES